MPCSIRGIMSDPTDYPYSPLSDALRSMFGRLGLVLAAVLLGSLCGCVSASGSLAEGLVYALGAPLLAFTSILHGPGVVALGLLLVFTILYTTWEWPRWLATVAVLLMWWDIHATLSHELEVAARFERLLPRQVEVKVTHSR